MAVGNPPYYSQYKIANLFVMAAQPPASPGGRVYMVSKQADWFLARMSQLFRRRSRSGRAESTWWCGGRRGSESPMRPAPPSLPEDGDDGIVADEVAGGDVRPRPSPVAARARPGPLQLRLNDPFPADNLIRHKPPPRSTSQSPGPRFSGFRIRRKSGGFPSFRMARQDDGHQRPGFLGIDRVLGDLARRTPCGKHEEQGAGAAAIEIRSRPGP